MCESQAPEAGLHVDKEEGMTSYLKSRTGWFESGRPPEYKNLNIAAKIFQSEPVGIAIIRPAMAHIVMTWSR
jgi:hypothetical protein